MVNVVVDLRHQYEISVAELQTSSWRNVPGDEELGETAIFVGYVALISLLPFILSSQL